MPVKYVYSKMVAKTTPKIALPCIELRAPPFLVLKMPQSRVGSLQGKNTGNMPSAMCALSMNKSLDPTPI